MADGESAGSDRSLADALSLDADPDDPAQAEAARRDRERIEKEREEAARRLAAARAQIAEFDQGRRKGSKWHLGGKKARENAELLEDMTREAAAQGYQEPDYDRPDSRDAGREVLAAFAETVAEAKAAEAKEAEAPAESNVRALRSLRSAKAKREKGPSATSESAPAAPPPQRPRLQIAREAPPVADPQPEPATPQAPAARAPERSRGRGAERPRTGFSMNVDFKPRTMTRTILTVLLLLVLAATVFVGLTLREDQNTLNVGLTATLGFVLLLVYAIRAGAPVVNLRVRGGLLEIKRGGRRDVFDLSSRFTPIDVIGRPGRQGWKVVMLRTDGMPQLIDSSIVDPKHFMEVLMHYRPDLDPDA